MLNVLFWVAFGCVIGWVAAILQDESTRRKLLAFILAGAVGGLFGGFGGALLEPQTAAYQTNTTDIMFAVFGATTFVFLAGAAASRWNRSQNN
jgi:uncharacterized membrane protein YeaQ/YmgE (transglycosylase-associated protein family)